MHSVNGVLDYVLKHLSDDEASSVIVDMLDIRDNFLTQEILIRTKPLRLSYIVERILDGDTSTGDSRLVIMSYIPNIYPNLKIY